MICTYFKNELNLEMMMWGDRLLDDAVLKYGKWNQVKMVLIGLWIIFPETSLFATGIMKPRTSYPSVDFFISKGFRVLPSWWKMRSSAGIFELFREI
jgi:hypothetical protein